MTLGNGKGRNPYTLAAYVYADKNNLRPITEELCYQRTYQRNTEQAVDIHTCWFAQKLHSASKRRMILSDW